MKTDYPPSNENEKRKEGKRDRVNSSLKTLHLSDIRHRFKVYLAGPINGLSYEESVGWRDYVIQKLPDEIAGYSPLRDKTYLANVEKFHGTYDDWPLSTQKGIFARDFNDCRTSDLILANLLNKKEPAMGTIMEIAWGRAFEVPVVAIMEEDNIHRYPMILECCPFIVNNLDEAIDVISAILLPGSH